MTKVWKTISSTIAVLLTLALFFGAGYAVRGFLDQEAEVVEPIAPVEEEFDLQLPAEVEKRVVTVEEVEVVLVDISQFSTYSGEYTATKSAEYTRYFIDNIPVPGTTNAINIECQGIVKVGYDVEDITVEVDNDSQKIYISLPAPEVLDNYIIWDTVRCQEENNILNPIDFEQYQSLIAEIEADGLTIAEEKGIYADAEENMKVIIRNFLSGFEDYEIIFL